MTTTGRASTIWDPGQYERFAAERARPFHDLVSRVDLPGARRVADLGCGPGALTVELASRWPAAHVEGVDSSPEMIAAARAYEIADRLEFHLGDVRAWEPEAPLDVIVSNATLQWVPDHLRLLDRLAGFLEPGGYLAVQVPGNFSEPSHRLLAELRASSRWEPSFAGRSADSPASHEPGAYLAALAGAGLATIVWETTYFQVLEGDDAVLEWMKGTALRPVLGALAPSEHEVFLADYRRLLREAYPRDGYGTVLPFRRVFAVGRRAGGRADTAISSLDHVQIAIPRGGEAEGRAFYGGLLGLAEATKPPALAARGGCWFRGHLTEIHLGAEDDFRPARKAHVAVSVTDLGSMAERLSTGGHPVTWDDELAPRRRFFAGDPFGNRLEFLEPLPPGPS